MSRNTANKILEGEVVDSVDAARVVLEMLEGLGEKAEGLGHREVMALLRQVVTAGVEVVKRNGETVTFRELVEACLAFKRERVRPVTMRDLRSFTNRLLRIPGLAEKKVRFLRVEECRAALGEAFAGSAHSYRKGRAILHGLFTFARRRGWCGLENPVDHIEPPLVREREIRPLSIQEVERLLRVTERPEFEDMRLSVYLMTYCGIRPAEVARMTPQDVDLRAGRVYVRPRCSKTGGGRVIPLRRAELLRSHPLRIPCNWQGRWRSVRRAAGFCQWVPDVLRHTFASYHAASFQNLPLLQSEMGHRDSSLLRTRYVNSYQLAYDTVRQFWT